jgi:hypothetical protein
MESSQRTILVGLLALFAASTLISMSAMSLFSSLLVLFVLWLGKGWWQQQSQNKIFNRVGFDWIWLLWLIVVAAGFAYNGTLDSPWAARMFEFNWIILFYALIAAFLFVPPKSFAIIPGSAVIALASLYAIVIYFLGYDPINPAASSHNFGGQFRTGGFFSNPMTLAHVYAMAFCLAAGQVVYLIKWRDQRFWWPTLAVALSGSAILLTFTRGVWLALAVAVPIMAFFFRKRVGALILVVMMLSYFGLRSAWPNFAHRVDQALNWEQNYDSERVAIWKANWAMFLDYPVVGVGYGENKMMAASYYEKLGLPETTISSHAHNQYLHFMSGTGTLGILVYLVVLIMFLKLTVQSMWAIPDRDYFEKGIALGALGAQIAFIVGGLTEANFEHAKVKYMLCIVWALVAWLAYKYKVLRE